MITINNLKSLLYEYEQKRIRKIANADAEKEFLYKQLPRLEEIDNNLSKLAISYTKALINSTDDSILEKLNTSISKYKEEKLSLLMSIGKNLDDLSPKYDCKLCQDTGYITQNSKTIMCNCLKQKLLDIEFNKCNISNLKNECFEKFNDLYFSDQIDEKKYGANMSPRENIHIIKDIAFNFIENFDNPAEKNLLFTGNAGLGKTFFSSCIANEIIKKGKTVLYQTAPAMFDSIIDFRFGKKDANPEICQNILNCDLLIIDDLGTESMNTVKFSELFNIINTRILNQGKCTKTIISTNLNLSNLFSKYDERIVSRFVGYYNICRFFGDDIRFKISS